MITRGRIVGYFFLVLGDVDAALPVAIAKANSVADATIVIVDLGPVDN